MATLDPRSEALKSLAEGLQGMITAGDNDSAQRIYKEKQAQYGFTDAEFAPHTANMGVGGATGFSEQNVTDWANTPVVEPVVPTIKSPQETVPQETVPQKAFAASAPDITATTQTTPTAKAVASSATLAAPVVAGTAVGGKWDVTPDQTVQSQIEKIIKENSPLQQQSEGLSTQRMNDRGLINTSINTQAGLGALYANALPMAQQDASTYAKSAQFNAETATDVSKTNVDNALRAGIVNQSQANDLAKFNADLLTKVNLSNVKSTNEFQQFALKQAFDARVINQEQYNAMSRFNAGQGIAIDEAALNRTAATNMDATRASYSALLEASRSATTIMTNTQSKIASIMADTALDTDAKNNAKKILEENATVALKLIGSFADVDLSGAFD